MCQSALVVVLVGLLTGSVSQAARYQPFDRAIVDPIVDIHEATHSCSETDLDPYFVLSDEYLFSAALMGANLNNASFSTSTILYDGQTVLEYGFDAATLQPS